MKTRIQNGRKATLILLFATGLAFGAVAQWQLGQQVFSPPRFGTYFALSRGTNAPPLPGLPPAFKDAAVYEVAGKPGRYVYDDSGYDYLQAALTQRLAAENDTEEENTPVQDGPTPAAPSTSSLAPRMS